MYDPRIHDRKSRRLKGYDYASIGYYFITLNVQDNLYIFGEIKDETMYLSKLGELVREEWEKTGEIRKNIKLHEYVIMPNHFHALIEICYSKNKNNVPGEFRAPSHTVGAIIRSFKGAVTRRSNASELGYKKIWQRDYYDQVIRNRWHLYNVRNYINENVSKWSG